MPEFFGSYLDFLYICIMLKLRGTQEKFVSKGVEILTSDSTRKEIMVAPVAYGKSICIANIVSRLNGRTIVLQPNKELLEQNYAKYTSYGYQASIFSASLGTKELSDVTYATIGSIKSHVDAVKAMKFKYIIIDECHLGTARNASIDKFIKATGIKNVLGVTATPVLLTSTMAGATLKVQSSAFKNMFTRLSHVVQIPELVKAGYWSNLVYDIRVENQSPLLQYNTSGSDYTNESMKKAWESLNLDYEVVKAVQELRREGRKSILIFAPTVDTAKSLRSKIEGCEIVHGDLKKATRTKVIENFKALKTDVVVNVNVLTAGFDHPQLDAIVLARPTASVALYYQIMGRGTRIHPKKVNTKIVDLSGNVSNFGRVEDLNYEFIPGYGWGLFSNETLLTDFPIKSSVKPTKASLAKKATKKGIEEVKVNGETKLWFGKHNGKKIKDVPKSYLSFILDNFDNNSQKIRDLKEAIRHVLNIK